MANAFLVLGCISLIGLIGVAYFIWKTDPSDQKKAAIQNGIISSLPSALIVGLFISGTVIYIQEREANANNARDRLTSKRSVLITLQSELVRMHDALTARLKFKPSGDWAGGERDSGMQSRTEFVQIQMPLMTDQPLSGGFWQSLSNSGRTSLIADDSDLLLQSSTAYDLINFSIACEQRLRDLIFSFEAPTGLGTSDGRMKPFWEDVAQQCLTTYGNAAPKIDRALADIRNDLENSN